MSHIAVWRRHLMPSSMFLQVKYGAVCSEREEMKKQISLMQAEIQDLREASERRLASDRVEVWMFLTAQC